MLMLTNLWENFTIDAFSFVLGFQFISVVVLKKLENSFEKLLRIHSKVPKEQDGKYIPSCGLIYTQ